MTAPARQPYPWRVEDLLRWYAVLAVSLLGLGATIWISADLRDEWRKLDEVADLLAEHRPAAVPAVDLEPVE